MTTDKKRRFSLRKFRFNKPMSVRKSTERKLGPPTQVLSWEVVFLYPLSSSLYSAGIQVNP